MKAVVNIFEEPPVSMPHAPDLYLQLTGDTLDDIFNQIKKHCKKKTPFKLQIFVERDK